MAKITVALLRDLESQVLEGKISYSRMVEILNQHSKHQYEDKLCYYKIKANRIHDQGERYFRYNFNSNHATQVCLQNENETKRGRGHYIGIYQISRQTFLTNWYPKYIDECSENDFNIASKRAMQLINI
jgi:hypothetical protein